MIENKISYQIRGAIFKVYNYFGPGLFETVYEKALMHELGSMNVPVESQVGIPVDYFGNELSLGYRLDILVDNKVIVEIKSVEFLDEIHHKQILTYLKLTKLRLGILFNFNTDCIEKSIYRKVNGLY